MSIKEKDIKLLWGRSGNRCAICKKELTQDKKSVAASFTLGEQAHIVGEKEDASRGKSSLTFDERNSYHNLILLCPTDHTKIDKNEDDWPIEKLHQVKSEHELWVSETLSEITDQFKLAKQVAVTSIIDAAVDLCNLENWKNWTSFSISPDPIWPADLPDKIFEFRQKVIAAIWPDEFDELKKATIIFSVFLNRAAQTFLEHSELRGDSYYPYKFYKAKGWNENYDQDVAKYRQWVESCHSAIYEATKSANWFADVVRRDINPMFFSKVGKFIILEGDIECHARLLEFTKAEREAFLTTPPS